MDQESLHDLYDRYVARRLSPSDLAELRKASDSEAFREVFGNRMDADWDALSDGLQTEVPQERLGRLFEGVEQRIRRSNPRRLWAWLPYAAAVILAVAAGTWFFGERGQKSKEQVLAAADIQPGGNRAMLTLADGRTVELSEEQEGIVVGEGITYLDGSAVSPEVGKSGSPKIGLGENQLPASDPRLLTLTTPKGGTYRITLPDGTRVWLNAASTLKYPSRFDGRERVVELEGEAYFEVASAFHLPFKVITNSQTVEVLGTQFNISAYADEAETRTTLVEGAVAILNRESKTVNQLKPGEQSIVREAMTEVRAVDVNRYAAWKDGKIVLEGRTLPDILREVSRWYDIEISYQGRIPQGTFFGRANRGSNLGTVLRLLESADLDYSFEGRTLIVKGSAE